MKKHLGFAIVAITLELVLVSSNKNVFDRGTPDMDRSKINNLRAIDPLKSKTYAQILIERISKYETCVKYFELAAEYGSDYVQVEVKLKKNLWRAIQLVLIPPIFPPAQKKKLLL